MSTLLFCCVASAFLAFQTRWLATFFQATSGHATQRQVCLCGRSDVIFGLVGLLGGAPLSLDYKCFKKPLVAFVFSTSCYFRHLASEARVRSVARSQRPYSVLPDGPSSVVGWSEIPAFPGSQLVLSLNIAHATTAILRASAMAAFFLRVFCPPWMRS